MCKPATVSASRRFALQHSVTAGHIYKKSMRHLLTCCLLLLSVQYGYNQTYAFLHGQWWTGKTFAPKTVYSTNGVFSFAKPAKIDSSIDLHNAFCIPPFADAHTHNLDGTRGLTAMIKQYLTDGVFYVQVLGNYGSGALQTRKVLSEKGQLEAVFANGLLTATYGHGFYPYEPLAMGIYIPRDQMLLADSIKKSRRAENNAYFFMDSKGDVDQKWPLVMQYQPDLLKICLLDAIHYPEKRKAEKPDSYGLSPEVAAYVVEKAHRQGLRVFAHVETAEDARICVRIGVDGLAHLPGYFWDGKAESESTFCITAKDIRGIRKAGMLVVPTMNIQHANDFDSNLQVVHHPERLVAIRQYQRQTLQGLYKAGVPIGLGADYFGKTVSVEIDSLLANRIFEPQQLMDIYCRQTPQLIFPKRKIGEIRAGFEASFLVLSQNPLLQPAALRQNILARYKKGKFVDPSN